ncbi:hypothetical protein, conserved [Trypanosoma brucei brucei TREU927]|uniref:Mini-chromosome maintenance complex-binding protein n=2 Tax=Trypanozoon TaxID=39700 RepID=Q57V33_TRYB2|nr:hypothetical protein, conserved [Trypanosoma brucei brucei TREU927]AAX70536.1 hypothetical protein, conserved [Trypanosoma brucei]AAZ12242.1 hypothetical protein, conserved [Trypanosoma brucei brucei TREU927]
MRRVMDRIYSQPGINAIIREKAAELGSAAAALSYVHRHLREALSSAEVATAVHDVFPIGASQDSVGKLCRCRGMIQEVDPSVALYRASPNNFLGAETTDDAVMLEALQVYVIPVPGNAHFYGIQDQQQTGYQQAQGAATCTEGGGFLPADTSDLGRNSGLDRKRRERTPMGDQTHQGEWNSEDPDVERDPKQSRYEGDKLLGTLPAHSAANVPLHHQLNLPHPPLCWTLHTACVVTVIYGGSAEEEPLRLNDVVDFFGFIDEPSIVEHSCGPYAEVEDFENFDAWHTEQLPPGVLPRMTCLSWQRVYCQPDRPLCHFYFESKRPLVLQHLKNTVCKGDSLLAEYILLHLCARVITQEGGMPVGDLPLRVEGDIVNLDMWSAYMREVAPVGEVLLDLSKLTSSSLRVTSSLDEKSNILRAGVLQLANGTHVTLDSRAVAIASSGVQDAIFSAVHKQVLQLEYPYQKLELPIDLSFLVLSTTKLTDEIGFLQLAVSVRWLPELTTEAAISNDISVDEVRDYFAQVRRLPRRFEREDDISTTQLSDKLLAFSQSEPRWNNHDSFIHNNSFAMAASMMRAYAASVGREVITNESVGFVLALEGQRVARCYDET